MDPAQPLYGLRMLDSAKGAHAGRLVETLAGHYVTAMRSVQPHGPYLLIGLCGGSYIAFEMARMLAQQGEKVALLAAIDYDGPRPRSLLVQSKVLLRRYRGRRRSAHQWIVDHIVSRMKKTATRLRFAAIRRKNADRLKKKDRRAHRRQLMRDYEAELKRYRAGRYAGGVELFLGEDSLAGFNGPVESWGAVASRGVEVTVVPGTHDSLFDEANINLLAEALQRRIDCLDRQCSA